MPNADKKIVILVGGGTMGSVSPLLALKKEITEFHPDLECIFIGTKGGVEQEPVELTGMEFIPIASAKFNRFFTPRNIIEPFRFIKAFTQAKKILKKYKPRVVIGTGGFVQVPVMRAAKSLGIPYVIHQQDIRPSLSNKLVAKSAKLITVTFEKSLKDYKDKARWTGNPLSQEVIKVGQNKDKSVEEAYKVFNLNKDKPVIFITGGGTGALAINSLVEGMIEKLVEKYQVIHQTGRGKSNQGFRHQDYHQFEFLESYSWALACLAAEVVISRAGMSTICELSYFKKPAIIIPIPRSHQEDNANYLKEKQAALVLDQDELNSDLLWQKINSLGEKQKFSDNISKINKPESAKEILQEIKKWI